MRKGHGVRAGSLLGYLLLVTLMTACPPPPPPPVASITVAPPSLSVTAGDAGVTLTATVQNSSAAVSWTLEGPGSLSGATGATTVYTPPASVAARATATIQAQLGGTSTLARVTVTIEPAVGEAVGPAGGTVRSSDNLLSVTVPAGALSETVRLRLEQTDAAALTSLPPEVTQDEAEEALIFRLSADRELVLSQDVTVSLDLERLLEEAGLAPSQDRPLEIAAFVRAGGWDLAAGGL